MNKKLVALVLAACAAALIFGLWACASKSSSSSPAADDDVSPTDDDASPTDDDTSPTDDDTSPTDDDDNDDDDASPGETWTDPSTHLMWEVSKSGDRDLTSALSYCNSLSAGGFGDWQLPTIDQLRTIVTGCADTETSGACGVTDSCTKETCHNSSCDGCKQYGGPGGNGCYLPAELGGDCAAPYWSQTPDETDALYFWAVDYSYASVIERSVKNAATNVRCVRAAS